MKFKFPYENLMKTKKVTRDVAFRNFSDAQNEEELASRELAQFYSDITRSLEFNQEVSKPGVVSPSEMHLMRWTQHFMEGQKIKIERQRDVVQKKQETLEEKGMALSEAAKDFKIFEKLKERMKSKFKKAQKKHDVKTIDEIVVMRSRRDTYGPR